ncbi:allergen fus c 3 [Colletotrichum spaethianum]|uniref:Allergen fus c 3 n=1 Tax=Colletotrichum spaethianum TaxID=700344 RepID=A0AA37LAN5_9PEZI|nr:allergen fus c 3 [Colletotrichum spaethianum]GKT43824.1 allergen fus c 3 [Colletotrichum spaethianum]
MASTPMSPHFPADVFGGAFDAGGRPHHATRPGNQTTLLSPDHNRPNSFNEPTTATTLNQGQTIAGVPGLATAQLHQAPDLQHQLQQPQLHPSALSLGLTYADSGQGHRHQHRFRPEAASFADQQGPSSLLHTHGHEQPPNTWLPPGYGVLMYPDSQQQHADPTSPSTTAGVNPPATISAAGDLINSSDSIGAGGHLYDFGFTAPPCEPSFLGGDYADIRPLSTAAAAAAHPQPPTTTFDVRSSPWQPRLQDSSSVTLTQNIEAVAAAELNHDVRKHSKSSMEADRNVKDPAWNDEDNEWAERRGGAAGTNNKTPSGSRRQERKGKRRAVADPGASGVDDDDADGDDEPTSPAGRTSISGRSIKSVSAASSAGSNSKAAPVPRLRSASRTSKNQSQKPTETPEERRTRASHNLVEKQYRNRLNAQFEGLLNALPEQVRGPAGAGDVDESDPQQADEERRVSKAEVLDMARRHIKNLEREREVLHRERGELLRNLETLEREAAVSGGGGGRLDEFLDVEGASDERGEPSWRNA